MLCERIETLEDHTNNIKKDSNSLGIRTGQLLQRVEVVIVSSADFLGSATDHDIRDCTASDSLYVCDRME